MIVKREAEKGSNMEPKTNEIFVGTDWDNMVFRFGYELTEAFVYSEDGVKGNDELAKGVFEIRQNEGEWDLFFVTPIEGIDFCGKGLNQPVKFGHGSAYGG